MTETDARRLADTISETAFAAHRFLRYGQNEKVYENSLRNRLRKLGLKSTSNTRSMSSTRMAVCWANSSPTSS